MNDDAKRIRVGTYNIHQCIGSDGLFDPERTVAAISQLQGDIIALQELETRDAGGLDLLDYFHRETGMYGIAGPTLYRRDSHYGNALLCRHEPKDVRLIDISVGQHEPRGAITCRLEFGAYNVLVIATHFGLRPSERRQQAEKLLASLERNDDEISILMGDINEWFMWGRPLRRLQHHFSKTDAPRTFPARFPMFALDRIWVKPGWRLEQLSASDSPLTRQASDHLPLTGELRL